MVLILTCGVLVAITMSSGDIEVSLGKLLGITSISAGGDYTEVSAAGESVGATQMTGGEYSLGSTLAAIAASKLASNLVNAHVYPNPYKPNSNDGRFNATSITFSQLTSHVKIRVYDIAGELVYNTEQDTPNGTLQWDVTNNRGSKLASGVYIYLVTDNNNNKAKGKFAVIK